MGYFDKLSEAAFKQTNEGLTVYYPNGAMGKGRLVLDQKKKEELLKFHKRLIKTVMFIVMPYSWLIGMSGEFTLMTISPILVIVLVMLIKQHLMIRKLPKHDLKLGLKEAMDKGAKALPPWYSWLLGIISTICLFFSLSLPYLTGRNYSDHLELVIGLSIFSMMGIALSIKMHRAKALSINFEVQHPRSPEQEHF